MRMWKMRILYVFVGLIVIWIGKESIWTKPAFRMDQKARGKLAELPGRIKVEFVDSEKYWEYFIAKGELVLGGVKDVPPAHLEIQPYIYFAKDTPNWLPKIEGLKYYGPYRLSPDKSLMFLSLSSKDAYIPKDFVLIQMEGIKLLFERKNCHWIEDMAWSPDSNMFAVLNMSTRLYFGVSGILSFVLRHPVMVCKCYLSIYDKRGNLLINAEVASGLLAGGGRVYWEDKGEEREDNSGNVGSGANGRLPK